MSSAANPATGAGRMNEQKEHLTIGWVSGCVAGNAVCFVGGGQQHVRRQMIGHELIAVPPL